MITAKQAKDGTQIDKYIEAKIKDIEGSIKFAMKIGHGFVYYKGDMPSSVADMLVELGYTIENYDDLLMSRVFLISWVKDTKKGMSICN